MKKVLVLLLVSLACLSVSAKKPQGGYPTHYWQCAIELIDGTMKQYGYLKYTTLYEKKTIAAESIQAFYEDEKADTIPHQDIHRVVMWSVLAPDNYVVLYPMPEKNKKSYMMAEIYAASEDGSCIAYQPCYYGFNEDEMMLGKVQPNFGKDMLVYIKLPHMQYAEYVGNTGSNIGGWYKSYKHGSHWFAADPVLAAEIAAGKLDVIDMQYIFDHYNPEK